MADDADTEPQKLTIPYERLSDYREVFADGFNYQFLSVASGISVRLTATTDVVRISGEVVEGEQSEGKFVRTGARTFEQELRKLELVSIRMNPNTALDLARLMIRQASDFGPTAIEFIQKELDAVKGK